MEDNEDEPIDVQIATPVVDEVVKGEIDEESSKPRQPFTFQPIQNNRCPKEFKQKVSNFISNDKKQILFINFSNVKLI